MMPPSNLLPKQATKEENQSSSNKKAAPARPQEQPLKCPRCDSSNTKFCYYNNYSLTQPRHFCKTCRRYWTKGGALRNVPIGGGCRKNRKIKSSSRLSRDSKDSSGSSEMGGFKFFHGISPAMDFNLGGLSYSRLNLPPGGIYNQLSSFGDLSASSTAPVGVTSPRFSLDPSGSSDGSVLGFNCPFPSVTSGFGGVVQEKGGGSVNVNTTLVSSIESLSSINQDLHWKLQQQRLAMLLGGDNQKDNNVSSTPLESQAQRVQPILFQNLEISKSGAFDTGNSRKGGASGSDIATEWFFGNSYGQVSAAPPSNNNGNGNGSTTNWNEVQAWGDLHQYNALP